MSLLDSPIHCSTPENCAGEPALRAHFSRTRHLRPGLRLHADDTRDAADFTARTEIAEGVCIVLLLEGSVDVSYGHRRLMLSSNGATRPAPRAVMVSVGERDQFTRRGREGTYARRVSLALGRDWLAQLTADGACGAVRDFVHTHLALQQWRPSQRAVAIAEQLVRPPALEPLLQNLYLETRALELVTEAFSTLAQHPADAGTTGLRPREHRRLLELRDFLSRNAHEDLSLDDIARHAGVNPNTLQKQFRALFGTTVFDFLRDCRLQKARLALERDGVTVGQAALLAGYSSAANFATAYKRRFGIAPKLARARF